MKKIKLGISPLSWVNSDFPEIGSHIAIDHCLSEISQIGYEGVEFEDPFRKDLDSLQHKLTARNLRCTGGWLSVFILEHGIEKEINRLKEHLEILKFHGGNVAILAESSFSIHRKPEIPLSKRPNLDEKQWKTLIQGLDYMAKIISDEGLVSAYHHHMGTVIQDTNDINHLMDHTNHLGLLYDTGHLIYSGENYLELLKKHLARITHIQLKNVRSSILAKSLKEDSGFIPAFLEGAFTVPGDDLDVTLKHYIDFQKIMEILVEGDYNGWVVVEAEQDPRKAEPFIYAQLGFQTLNYLYTKALFKKRSKTEKKEIFSQPL